MINLLSILTMCRLLLQMGSFMNHLLAMDAATVTPSAMLRQLEPSLMLTAAQVDQLDGAALPLPVMHDSVRAHMHRRPS